MTARRSRRRYGAVLGLSLAGLSALAFAAVAAPTPRLVWNASPSAPIGLYRLDPAAPITLGRRVAYRPTPDQARLFARRRYLPQGVPLLKTVAAEAPAEVCRDGRAVRIDGRTVAHARRTDRAGRPLPTWSGCRRLSSDQILLLSADAPDSLDGRYFGPVSRGRILGVVTPLWIREPVR